jgi:hypothetical protein
MKTLSLSNSSVVAAVVCSLVQAGAQLFAVVVVVGTVTQAPPRSLAMFAGEYGYDSASFWNAVPMVTLVALLGALVFNWKTRRRRLLAGALALFVITGLFTALVMGPVQAEVLAVAYSDAVSESLRSVATRWRTLDWLACALTLAVGLLASLALAMPGSSSSGVQ